MPIYIVTIVSNNKKSLANFLFFLFKNLKINFIYKFLEKKQKKKIFTVLKSPHVNKKAQEQFEIRTFSKQIKLLFYNSPKYLVVLKKIKVNLFPDVKIKVEFILDSKKLFKSRSRLFNVSYYRLVNKSIKHNKYKLLKNKCFKGLDCKNYLLFKSKLILKTKNYLKIFDCYGELNLSV